MSIKIFDIA
jgi:hypothetical protein